MSKEKLEKTENLEIDPFDMTVEQVNNLKPTSNSNNIQKHPDVYKPSVEKKGDKYKAKIRFIANVGLDFVAKNPFLEVAKHFLPKGNKAKGSHTCKNQEYKSQFCPICNAFAKYKSENGEIEAKKLISRAIYYYSYVQIIDDENHPELNGSIMIMEYGQKIKEKINELEEDKINAFNVKKSKNFKLVIKLASDSKRDTDYSSCSFEDSTSAVKVFKDGKFVDVYDENGNFRTDKDGKTDKFKKALVDYINSCPTKLEEFDYKDWEDDEAENIDDYIAELLNINVKAANNKINSASSSKNNTSSNAFEDDDDDDFTSIDNGKDDKKSKPKAESNPKPEPVEDTKKDDFEDDLPF